MRERVAITGGAGFIGSNLAETLAGTNEVVVVDDLSTGRMKNLQEIDVEFILGSVADRRLLTEAFQDATCVFHLAAIPSVQRSVEDPLGTSRVNHDGTLNVLLAARDAGVDRVVFSSSTSIYGDSPEQPKREDMVPAPRSPYAVAKLAGEHYCLAFNDLYAMRNVALRYFNVYGPRQDPGSEYAAVIPKFIMAALHDEVPVIYGDGEQTRDFVFVKDVVAANIQAMNSARGGVYNIASGRSFSINQLLAEIERAVGKEIKARHEPPRSGEVRHSSADIARAGAMGYQPGWPLERGLKETVDWFSEQRDG